jgi:hypothetical protein
MAWVSDAAKWAAKQLGKVAIWIVFVVGFSLLPLFLVYNNRRMGGEDLALETLFAGGELLLVVTAVAADSMGRFFSFFFSSKRTANLNLWQLLLFLLSLVLVIMSATEYSSLLTRLSLHGDVDAAFIVRQSEGFFWATLMTGASVIMTIDE